ncbi:MAG: DUF523 domain-containing protein [Bacillota bacterium]
MVSACLLGVACAYDGRPRRDGQLLEGLAGRCILPVCPEQLGGLPTPRTPAEITGGGGSEVLRGRARVLIATGDDVTRQYLRGAREVCRLAEELGTSEAVLKPGSPACGPESHYDGTFTSRRVEGMGVAARALWERGVRILTPKGYLERVRLGK